MPNSTLNHLMPRRVALTRVLGLGGTILLATGLQAARGAGVQGAELEAMRPFMEAAERMRKRAVGAGDQAYGAVMVRDGRIVAEGPSRVVVDGDPTAHAEMVAVREAARRLGTRDLKGCVLFATSRPCRMCETASYWAGVDRIYYSAEIRDGGPPRYDNC